MKLFWAKEYSDYHPEAPGGSAAGRTCECRPLDTAILGEYLPDLRPGIMEVSIPMPTTGADYRWMNLMSRVPPRKGLPTILKRLAQGVGGLALGRRYAAGGQALAAGLFAGAIRAGVPIWLSTALKRVDDRWRPGHRRRPRTLRHSVTVTARRGVVLAAGGFDHSMDMRWKFQSESLGRNLSLGAESNTGDAIRIGQDVGADISLMDQSWWFPAVAPPAGRGPGGHVGRAVAARVVHRRPERPPVRQRVRRLHELRSTCPAAGSRRDPGGKHVDRLRSAIPQQLRVRCRAIPPPDADSSGLV